MREAGQSAVLKKLNELHANDYHTGMTAQELQVIGGLTMNMQSIFQGLKRLKKGKFIKSKNGVYWIEKDSYQ